MFIGVNLLVNRRGLYETKGSIYARRVFNLSERLKGEINWERESNVR